MKKGERGQISIFIIVAIIIVALIVSVIIIKGNSVSSGSVSPQIQPIYDSAKNCLLNVGKASIYLIGQSGGYYSMPNYSTETGIAYYYDSGESFIPISIADKTLT